MSRPTACRMPPNVTRAGQFDKAQTADERVTIPKIAEAFPSTARERERFWVRRNNDLRCKEGLDCGPRAAAGSELLHRDSRQGCYIPDSTPEAALTKMQRRMSPLELLAADALRRARRLPVGEGRNDLRQLAMGLLWLHRNGMEAFVRQRTRQVASTPVDKCQSRGSSIGLGEYLSE